MKTPLTFLACWILPVCTIAHATDPAPASAEQRIERLEQRLDTIDRSLEQIVQLLQNRAAAPTAPAAPAVPTATAPAGAISAVEAVAPPLDPDAPVVLAPATTAVQTKPGVRLDVWPRAADGKGTVPTIPSLVTILDTRGPFFALGRYAAEREMASSVGKPLLQVWRCYLKITQAGRHVLIAEFRQTKDRSVAKSQPWNDYLFPWSAQLSVNGKMLLDETNKFESSGKGALARTFTLDLTPGYYAVQIVTWLPKQPADEIYDYKPLTFALRLREPGALKPRDLGPADFFDGQ